MEKYQEEGVDLITKEECYKDIDKNIPTNKMFKITATMIRQVLKDLVETLWPYKSKVVHIINSENQDEIKVKKDFYHIYDKRTYEWSVCDVKIPKCDVLIFDDSISNWRIPITYITMDGVQNGDTLKIIGNFYIATGRTKTNYESNFELNNNWFGNIGETFYAHSRVWHNRLVDLPNPYPVEGSYQKGVHIKTNDFSEHVDYTSMTFIHLMYWNGIWYECAY